MFRVAVEIHGEARIQYGEYLVVAMPEADVGVELVLVLVPVGEQREAAFTPVFGDIACGETVCGTAGTFTSGGGDSPDTHWYRIDVPVATVVAVDASGEFPILAGIVDNFGIDSCSGVTGFLVSDTADACGTVSVSATLTPGTWYLFVAPSDFTGVD